MSVKTVERRAGSCSFFIYVHKLTLSDETCIILAVYDIRIIFLEKYDMIHKRDGGGDKERMFSPPARNAVRSKEARKEPIYGKSGKGIPKPGH